jgi:UDP-2,4-diacetamido-2,4,6-trideoxy-beta-L-altropyranose hydrolase
MRVAIRTDASTKIGSGHVMRCLTLAEELRDSGAEVRFISRAHPGNLNGLIREKGFQCFELPETPAIETTEQRVQVSRSQYASWLGVSQQQDAKETIEVLGGERSDWLIVDHYGLNEEWEKFLRSHASKFMVIDDLADRRHDCDLLLDQNFFINGEKRYDDLVPPSCTKLLGPKYALLRREFREARKNLRERTGEVKRVLVFFGGSDPDNITRLAIEALSNPELLHLHVDVVIGAQNPNREDVEKLIQERPGITLHIQASNMAQLMSKADLAIGAGGSTTWERLYLGLPSIVIPIAKNQMPSTKDLCDLGVIKSLDKNEEISANCLKEKLTLLLANPDKLLEMSKNGIKIASCDKAKDSVNLIVGDLNGIKLTHREATLADCKLYWHWANDPEVRRSAFNSEPISWEKHQEWFAARLSDPNSILLIFESQYGPVGHIRLDGGAAQRTISYSVARQYRGKGIGKKIMSEVIAVSPPFARRFIAEVKKENLASANIFKKLGFQSAELLEKNAYSFTLDLGDTYKVV